MRQEDPRGAGPRGSSRAVGVRRDVGPSNSFAEVGRQLGRDLVWAAWVPLSVFAWAGLTSLRVFAWAGLTSLPADCRFGFSDAPAFVAPDASVFVAPDAVVAVVAGVGMSVLRGGTGAIDGSSCRDFIAYATAPANAAKPSSHGHRFVRLGAFCLEMALASAMAALNSLRAFLTSRLALRRDSPADLAALMAAFFALRPGTRNSSRRCSASARAS